MTTTAAAVSDNTAAVVSIGRRTLALGKSTDTVAAAIIAAMPADHDWSKRGAKPAAVHFWATGTTEKAAIPAQKDANQKATPYGIGVNTLVAAITRALDLPGEEKAPAMRVSLTGVGSAVVPTDHPAYALLLALLGAEDDEPAEEAAA